MKSASVDSGQDAKKKFLVRSNALCGDDDTRLRPTESLLDTPTRNKHSSANSSLSRDSTGAEYTDTTGIDLTSFIFTTLHKNQKDRDMLLSLEVEMRRFVLDKDKTFYKFPKMSSYNRMLVHRVAAFFGLDHNVDTSGATVVVSKTPNTRVPDVEFAKFIKHNIFTDKAHQLSRRSVQSFDESRFCGSNIYMQPHQQFYLNTPILMDGNAGNYHGGRLGLHSLDYARRARSFEVGEWTNELNSPGNSRRSQRAPSAMSMNANLGNKSNCGGSWQQLPEVNAPFAYSTSSVNCLMQPQHSPLCGYPNPPLSNRRPFTHNLSLSSRPESLLSVSHIPGGSRDCLDTSTCRTIGSSFVDRSQDSGFEGCNKGSSTEESAYVPTGSFEEDPNSVHGPPQQYTVPMCPPHLLVHTLPPNSNVKWNDSGLQGYYSPMQQTDINHQQYMPLLQQAPMYQQCVNSGSGTYAGQIPFSMSPMAPQYFYNPRYMPPPLAMSSPIEYQPQPMQHIGEGNFVVDGENMGGQLAEQISILQISDNAIPSVNFQQAPTPATYPTTDNYDTPRNVNK